MTLSRFLSLAFALVLLAPEASAQSASGGLASAGLRVLTDEAGRTHVYHTLPLRPDGGVVVTRESGGILDTLTAEPLAAPVSPSAFVRVAGVEALEALVQDDETPAEAFFRVRTGPVSNRLAAFLSPDVARGLGRLVIDETAPDGATVTYRATRVDADLRPDGEAAEATVTIRRQRPLAPDSLALDHVGRRVTVAWEYPANPLVSGGEDDGVVHFRLYREAGGEMVPVDGGPAILRVDNQTAYSTVITLASPEETAAVAVAAVDAMAQEARTETARYQPLAAEPPPPLDGIGANARREDGADVVDVTWPVSVVSDAAGYWVLRAERINGPYERLNAEPLAVLETVYIDRPEPGAYFYAVVVVDEMGNESRQSGAVAATVEDTTPPSAVTNLSAEPLADGSVRIAWTAPQAADYEGALVLRRRVAADGGPYNGGEADVQLNAEPTPEASWLDTGETGALEEGAFYRYAVVARDTSSLSADTAAVVLQLPDRTPPAPPTDLAALVDDASRQTVLRWQASASRDVGRYIVYRDSEPLAEVSDVALSFRDTTALTAVRYTYAVAAVDTLANEGPRSEPLAFARPDPDPPRPVYNLRARLDRDVTVLTWPAVPAEDLAHYVVESSSIPTGVFQAVGEPLTQTTLRVPTDFGPWFRVRAVDTSGNEGAPSEAVRARR
ncbi:fibronectin type III domain-containing protein [Rubricoccus marinus]|uniref:Fibronectin type-III domain-containing protein n=1 Tax=Rubricoccus marinus TaxID=716817 RepID=A0A259U2J8_9BACT|nr:hypothetical protein [Rubricoccus marinus]OZC04068.1 hypothetical protein BSZ36_14390 [Rubricoccus marinus]